MVNVNKTRGALKVERGKMEPNMLKYVCARAISKTRGALSKSLSWLLLTKQLDGSY